MDSTHSSSPLSPSLYFGIDGNEANVAKRVGSNIYAYQLLQSLHALSSHHRFNVFLKSEPAADLPLPRLNWQYKVLTPTRLWTQWRLPLELFLNRDRPQVFYSPSHYAPRFSPIPTVITVFDLAYLKFPNLFLKLERGYQQLKDWTDYSVTQAAHIIAISKHTKKDLISTYQLPEDNVSVAYPGIDFNFFKKPSTASRKITLDRYGLTQPYILYVGTLQPRKNLVRLVQAFEKLPPKFKSYELVLAGNPGWLNQELENYISISRVKRRIKKLGFVDKESLPALYSGAATVCLVGLYEGFGLPPAEAIACGTVPVVANTASLPEVVGKSGITVDPYSVGSITHGIITAVGEDSTKHKLRLKRITEHIQQFTWSNSAQIVAKVLYEIAVSRQRQ